MQLDHPAQLLERLVDVTDAQALARVVRHPPLPLPLHLLLWTQVLVIVVATQSKKKKNGGLGGVERRTRGGGGLEDEDASCVVQIQGLDRDT